MTGCAWFQAQCQPQPPGYKSCVCVCVCLPLCVCVSPITPDHHRSAFLQYALLSHRKTDTDRFLTTWVSFPAVKGSVRHQDATSNGCDQGSFPEAGNENRLHTNMNTLFIFSYGIKMISLISWSHTGFRNLKYSLSWPLKASEEFFLQTKTHIFVCKNIHLIGLGAFPESSISPMECDNQQSS